MNMLRIGSALLLLICVLFSLTGCPAIDDWYYDDLPGDYSVDRVNSKYICLCDDSGTIHVDRFIIAFCYNTRFIGLKRVPITTNEDFVAEKVYKAEAEFYLVDSKTNRIYGPLTEEGYNNHLISRGVLDMCEWITTSTKPEGAK